MLYAGKRARHTSGMKTLSTRYFILLMALAGIFAIGVAIVYFVVPALAAWLIPLLTVVILVNLFIASKAIVWDMNTTLEPAKDAIHQIAQGNKPQPLTTKRKDELGEFIEVVNEMMGGHKAVKEANSDPLTGLANRRHLEQRLDEEAKKGTPLSLIFIDLDGFKPINDTYGHEAGDIALKMVAERLGTCVRDHDVLCRLGGDEFVVLLIGLNDREVIKARGDKIIELVNQPYWIDNHRIKMGASLGIAIGPDDGKTGEAILAAADEAMYAAKQGGKNAYRFYS